MGLDFTTQFNEAIADFCLNQIPREYTRRQIDTLMYLRRRLIRWTPTKGHPLAPYATNHAKSNWQVTKGRPNKSVRGSRENPSKILTEQLVRTSITSGNHLRYGSKVMGFGNNGAYEVYKIFNNVHYVKYLETGSSRHSPNGIVRIAIAETFAHFGSKRNPYKAFSGMG